jgi:ribosomal protein L40E
METIKQKESDGLSQLQTKVQQISKADEDHHDSAEEEDNNEASPLQQVVHAENSIEKTRSGKVRVCHFCQQRKPDRTHHCRQCGVCILKMDHHCWWFNNCIGYYNYKYFFLFLFWTIIATLFVTSTMANSFIDVFRTDVSDR